MSNKHLNVVDFFSPNGSRQGQLIMGEVSYLVGQIESVMLWPLTRICLDGARTGQLVARLQW